MEDKDCRTADKEAGAPQPVLVWKVWKTAIVVGKQGQAQLFAGRQWKSFCFNLHDMEECGSVPGLNDSCLSLFPCSFADHPVDLLDKGICLYRSNYIMRVESTVLL